MVTTVVVVVVADAESFQDKVGLQAEALRLNRDHSLILVPVVKRHDLRRRSTNDVFDASESEKHQKKYQRLAHSVHVQSDIRYR